jgi:hypothetical protein
MDDPAACSPRFTAGVIGRRRRKAAHGATQRRCSKERTFRAWWCETAMPTFLIEFSREKRSAVGFQVKTLTS